ncbi:MAG: hypothetical protein CL920_18025 [Deltaproteobacteria bacterium]|nr:hypothetical protein [Deltaproteobacteria bacterium]
MAFITCLRIASRKSRQNNATEESKEKKFILDKATVYSNVGVFPCDTFSKHIRIKLNSPRLPQHTRNRTTDKTSTKTHVVVRSFPTFDHRS